MLTAIVPSTDLLSLDYLKACKLLLPAGGSITLQLIGCGGTGSWLAPSLVRIARILIEKFNKKVAVHFVDPDRVEAKNCYRQNFCQAEIGWNKAEALAFRYGLAWGVEIDSWAKPLREIEMDVNGLLVSIGCVDRASARKEIVNSMRNAQAWWLDCGNHKAAGQVLLGGGTGQRDPFRLPGYCSWLPLPGEQQPELLEPEIASPDVAGLAMTDGNLSCAEMALQDSQGLAINQRMAAEATDYLVRMLLTKDLTRMATYIDLASGSSRSVYITPENVLRKA